YARCGLMYYGPIDESCLKTLPRIAPPHGMGDSALRLVRRSARNAAEGHRVPFPGGGALSGDLLRPAGCIVLRPRHLARAHAHPEKGTDRHPAARASGRTVYARRAADERAGHHTA